MPVLFLILSFISGFLTVKLLMQPVEPTQVISPLSLQHYFLQKQETQKLYVKTLSAKRNGANSFAMLLTQPTVLGIATESAEPSPEAKIATPRQPQKAQYTIAVLGDSMVDTLGPGLPHLKTELAKRFPKTSFTLLNYGAASTNIEYGLTRLTNGYSYLGQSVPSLLSQNPDVVVIESFGYNHWENTQSDLDRQWLTVSKIIGTIKNHNAETNIILAATVAPHCPTYTDGSANLPPERKQKECETVKAYIQNLIRFAQSEKYPLANAYNPSLSGSDGNPKYINAGDHIHPSDNGKALFSRLVADQIQKVL